MIPISSSVRVWIACGHCDMRKGMQGLALIVQEGLGRDPFKGDVFVFRGKSGRLIKALWHDGMGFRYTQSGSSAAVLFGQRRRAERLR